MKYEIKISNTVSHLYCEKNLSAAIFYAKTKGLQVIERKTGKIIYPEKQNETEIYGTNRNK